MFLGFIEVLKTKTFSDPVVFWSAMAAVGQWFGAIATFAAVVVSLRLAKKSSSSELKIEVGPGFTTGGLEGISEIKLFISASNTGPIPITLNYTGFRLPRRLGDKERMRLTVPEGLGVLPRRLNTSDDIKYEIGAKRLAESLERKGYRGNLKLAVIFSDTTGKIHTKKFKFDTKVYLEATLK